MKNKANKLSNAIIFIWLFTNLWFYMGCMNNEFHNPKKYVEYINKEDDKIINATDLGDVTVSVKYLPSEYLALLASGKGMEGKSSVEQYEGSEYFELSIWSKERKTQELLREKAVDFEGDAFDVYFNFGIQRDIILKVNDNDFPCTYLHREISDAITNVIKYTLAFNTGELEVTGDRNVSIRLNQFGYGVIDLVIAQKAIDNLPQLKIQ